MFENIFSKFYNKNKEIKVIGVWSKDGLELEKKVYSNTANLDLEFVGAVLSDALSKIDTLKSKPEGYLFKLSFKEYLVTIFSLTQDYFLIVSSDKALFPGKLNFYFDLYKEKLTSLL